MLLPNVRMIPSVSDSFQVSNLSELRKLNYPLSPNFIKAIRILIEGETGSGKSFSLCYIAHSNFKQHLAMGVGDIQTTNTVLEMLFDPETDKETAYVFGLTKQASELFDSLQVTIIEAIAKFINASKGKMTETPDSLYKNVMSSKDKTFEFMEQLEEVPEEKSKIQNILSRIYTAISGENIYERAKQLYAEKEENSKSLADKSGTATKNKQPTITMSDCVEEVVSDELVQYESLVKEILNIINSVFDSALKNVFQGINEEGMYVAKITCNDFSSQNTLINIFSKKKGFQFFLDKVYIHLPMDEILAEMIKEPIVLVDTQGVNHCGDSEESILAEIQKHSRLVKFNCALFYHRLQENTTLNNFIKKIQAIKKPITVKILATHYDEAIQRAWGNLRIKNRDLASSEKTFNLFSVLNDKAQKSKEIDDAIGLVNKELIAPIEGALIEANKSSVKSNQIKFDERVLGICLYPNTDELIAEKVFNETIFLELIKEIVESLHKEMNQICVDVNNIYKDAVSYSINENEIDKIVDDFVVFFSQKRKTYFAEHINKHVFWASVYALKRKIRNFYGHKSECCYKFYNFTIFPGNLLKTILKEIKFAERISTTAISWDMSNINESQEIIDSVLKSLSENLKNECEKDASDYIAYNVTYKKVLNEYNDITGYYRSMFDNLMSFYVKIFTDKVLIRKVILEALDEGLISATYQTVRAK